MIDITTELTVQELANILIFNVQRQNIEHDDVMALILALDEGVAAWEFTVELRDRLTSMIEAEGEQ